MTPSFSKIFGIGLSKTGTSSLNAALNTLGIASIHFPSDPITYRELTEGSYHLTILEHYVGATDISVSPYFAQLDKAYPGSKFILTMRNLDSWLTSVEAHWEFMWRWAAHDRQFKKFLEFITASVYGLHKFHHDRFVQVYGRHEQMVREYFSQRSTDLLILDICEGDGWERLCPFLGRNIPSEAFPRANRREEKLEREEWIALLELAVTEVDAAIAGDARYILVDDERLAGSSLERPGRATRPMERQGVYSGPPSNSAEAIAEMQRMSAEGFQYLVIAWPSFWWLDHYKDMEHFLRSNYSLVLKNKRLCVFDLRTTIS